MSEEYEWGPWIEHDGKGCPVPVGTLVMVRIPFWGEFIVRAGCGNILSGETGPHGRENTKFSTWVFDENLPQESVSHYRIRKPRALSELQELIADIPAPVKRVEVEV